LIEGDFAAYGVFGKLNNNGNFSPLEATDTTVYGLLVRAYPTQSAVNELGKATPTASTVQDVLRRGYMTAVCNAGVAKKGGAVYVRVDAATTTKPIGGVEAVADGANTIEIEGAMFMHDADASGNVEIAYNI
ncbi:MAG: hypothetical protein ACK5LJ_14995, partial [Paracoccus sp. (in: a-proteobacteria)]